ncbi:MAG: hypothetical protein VKL41_15135, partial [Snowella sp.]|nr:hypothetical protein [Snowella sp.]
MSILESKKLKTRILLGYGVPVGLLALFALTIGVSMKLTSDSNNELVRANRVVDNVRESVMALSRIVRTARGAALFPNDIQIRDSYSVGKDRLEEHVTAMGDDIRDPQQKASWDSFMKEANTIVNQSDEIMKMIKSGKVAQAMPLLAELDIAAIDKTKDVMIKRQEDIIKKDQEAEAILFSITLIIIIVGLFGGSSISLILGNMIATKITNDVKKAIVDVTASSNEIAATMEEQERTANLQAASVSETT